MTVLCSVIKHTEIEAARAQRSVGENTRRSTS